MVVGNQGHKRAKCCICGHRYPAELVQGRVRMLAGIELFPANDGVIIDFEAMFTAATFDAASPQILAHLKSLPARRAADQQQGIIWFG